MNNFLPSFLASPKDEKEAPEEISMMDSETDGLLGKSGGSLEDKMKETKEEYSKPNYYMMFVFFGLGALFLMASLSSLPFIIIAPSGFNMYFSLASFSFLVSVSFFHGPCVYLQKILFDRSTLPISLLYLVSTMGSLYCSFFTKLGYLYTLGMIAIQALSVSFFVLQTWTGGHNAQDKLKGFVQSGVEAGVKASLKNMAMKDLPL